MENVKDEALKDKVNDIFNKIDADKNKNKNNFEAFHRLKKVELL